MRNHGGAETTDKHRGEDGRSNTRKAFCARIPVSLSRRAPRVSEVDGPAHRGGTIGALVATCPVSLQCARGT